MSTKWILIAGGGAIGSVTRFALQGILQPATSVFPFGTLCVNVAGCFAIGFLMTLFTGPYVAREEYRFGMVAGVLGGFTTFSAFSWESMRLIEARQWVYALLYISASVIVGLVATFCGIRLSQWLYGT